MENGGARILAAFEPCVLTDGSVVLNLTRRRGNSTCSSKYTSWTNNSISDSSYSKSSANNPRTNALYCRLNEQVTGPDPASGDQVTLNGNINALFLWNNGGQDVEFSGDNSVALNAILT